MDSGIDLHVGFDLNIDIDLDIDFDFHGWLVILTYLPGRESRHLRRMEAIWEVV
jgi:hypothetical protein